MPKPINVKFDLTMTYDQDELGFGLHGNEYLSDEDFKEWVLDRVVDDFVESIHGVQLDEFMEITVGDK